ncbi:MAG: FixH family protein [Chromatiales bacterium]|nr:FixH family protein [Chromatiales bacterium]
MQQQVADRPGRPWYRHYWVWLVMLPPFGSIVAGFTLLFHALASPNPLVVDDYSRIVRYTEQRLERDREAVRLGVTAELDIRTSERGTEVAVLVAPLSVPMDGLQLRFVHPTLDTLDQAAALLPDGAGGWIGQLPMPVAGRYYLQLAPAGVSWRLAGEWQGERSVVLRPPDLVAIDVR